MGWVSSPRFDTLRATLAAARTIGHGGFLARTGPRRTIGGMVAEEHQEVE
jgi:hypothetical protein